VQSWVVSFSVSGSAYALQKKLANIDWRDMEDKVEKKLLAGRLA
jgi:hypothetical protein